MLVEELQYNLETVCHSYHEKSTNSAIAPNLSSTKLNHSASSLTETKQLGQVEC